MMIDEVRTLYSWGVRLEEEIVLDRRVSTPLLQGLVKHELRSCKENQRLSWDEGRVGELNLWQGTGPQRRAPGLRRVHPGSSAESEENHKDV